MLSYNTGFDNDLDHSRTIQQHYLFLVDNLDAKYSALLDELQQAEVLSPEEMESINSEVISFIQNEKLLSVLSRKTEHQFQKFLDALDKTGQRFIRSRITGRQGNSLMILRKIMCEIMCDLLILYCYLIIGNTEASFVQNRVT